MYTLFAIDVHPFRDKCTLIYTVYTFSRNRLSDSLNRLSDFRTEWPLRRKMRRQSLPFSHAKWEIEEISSHFPRNVLFCLFFKGKKSFFFSCGNENWKKAFSFPCKIRNFAFLPFFLRSPCFRNRLGDQDYRLFLSHWEIREDLILFLSK